MSSYACSECEIIEDIPSNVLEYFDEINPAQLIFVEYEFECERCKDGIMRPISKSTSLVLGVGLFDGFKVFRF